MTENPSTQFFGNPLPSLVATLILPLVMTLWFRARAMQVDESERPQRWIALCQWLQVIFPFSVALWWSLWDLQGVSAVLEAQLRRQSFMDPTLTTLVIFIGLPTMAAAIARVIFVALGRTFFATKWRSRDLIAQVFWRTISYTVALLFVAAGFDAINCRKWAGVEWLIAAGLLGVVGEVRARAAEGINMRRVKSGDCYKRAFAMAESMGIKLSRVYVVPIGRGHLINAFGAPRMIAVTENYTKLFHGAELDSVIGHELVHGREWHGVKKLAVWPVVIAALALLYWFLPVVLNPMRPILDVTVILLPIVVSRFISRRFEYAADAGSVTFTKNPKAAVQALVNLYRESEAPVERNRFLELFMTHPALNNRIRAIRAIG
jgi:Zn-dependent protease with chaperone function